MQIYIRPGSSLVSVDDASIQNIDCSSIPANVELVMWESGKPNGGNNDPTGNGELLYNDRIAIRESFTDPTPYLTVINNWIKAAAGQLGKAPGQSAPPSAPHPVSKPVPLTAQQVTTAQAQAVKSTLADALFAVKNQAPITVGGQTYNAGSDETSAMANQIAAASEQVIQNINAAVQSAVNSAMSSMSSNTQTAFSSYVGSPSTAGSVNKALNDYSSNVNATLGDGAGAIGPVLNNLRLNVAAATAFPITVSSGWSAGDPAPTSTTAPTMPSAPTISLTEDGPNMSWPNSQGQTQNLTFSQMSALLKAITDRRTTLQTTHTSIKASIAAAATPVAAANIDITAGW